MLNGSARGDAQYAIVAQNPAFAKLNADEMQAVRASLRALFGADTNYLVQNTVVQPATLASPVGQAVAVTGSPTAQSGATTALGPLSGTGLIS